MQRDFDRHRQASRFDRFDIRTPVIALVGARDGATTRLAVSSAGTKKAKRASGCSAGGVNARAARPVLRGAAGIEVQLGCHRPSGLIERRDPPGFN